MNGLQSSRRATPLEKVDEQLRRTEVGVEDSRTDERPPSAIAASRRSKRNVSSA
ncbi:MAG TPA: hypothetical protein VG166_04960 [Caulobacteraceae bacterium]|nr:hypothetical protein [Caulobacteraceae bacterium]